MISNNITNDFYHIGHKMWVWFPVCLLYFAQVGQLGARSLPSVRNQEGLLVGGCFCVLI